MDKYPKPTSRQCTKIILEQMDNFIFKLSEKEENIITGFFCYIKYEGEKIPVLIANKNIINDISNNSINLLVHNNNKKIELGDIFYKDINQDLVILEIKKDKILNDIYFYEIDSKNNANDLENEYIGESIYNIYYDNQNKNIMISYGIINNINKLEIIYSCNINSNIQFCPIFNLSNNQIIGMYKCYSKYYFRGIIFKDIIHKFTNEYKRINKIKNKNKYIQNMDNEINIYINVTNFKQVKKYIF